MTDMFEAGYRFPVEEDKALLPGSPGPTITEKEVDTEKQAVATEKAADITLPKRVEPALYRQLADPTWNQRGEECTGFALAAAVNFLSRKNLVEDLPTYDGTAWKGLDAETLRALKTTCPSVSPRMMYEMAQVYDNEDYEVASTLQGALRGWWRCGVTTDDLWPYAADDEHGEVHGGWTVGRICDARTRKLQWDDEQQRIAIDTANPTSRLPAMKEALAQNQVLYVDAEVHAGWFRPLLPGVETISFEKGDERYGFHAFLIVGYDECGFWVHNSWGRHWGEDGYALLPYKDWYEHGRGVWVPSFKGAKQTVTVDETGFRQTFAMAMVDEAAETMVDAAEGANLDESEAVKVDEADYRTAFAKAMFDNAGRRRLDETEVAKKMWGHVVALDDEGRLSRKGLYEATSDSVRTLFYLFEQRTKTWRRPRLLVFADDGSRPRAEVIEELAKRRKQLTDQEIYPIFLVWDVPWLPDLADELKLRDRDGNEDILGPTGDRKAASGEGVDWGYWFYEYRVAQTLAVEMWKAMQQRAERACTLVDGGARILAQRISEKSRKLDFDLHIAAHGAGDFLMSRMASLLPPVVTAELWAPATTIEQFEHSYASVLGRRRLDRMTITVLDDESERADEIGNYPQSVLCLASNVLAVDGIDGAGRFSFGPSSESEALQSAPESKPASKPESQPSKSAHELSWVEAAFRDWERSGDRIPKPILGLERCIDAAPGLTGRPDRVVVQKVAGSRHFQLTTKSTMWQAAAERIKQEPAPAPARPSTEPAPEVTKKVVRPPRDPVAAALEQRSLRSAPTLPVTSAPRDPVDFVLGVDPSTAGAQADG